jgi:hypothetical protein
MNIGPAIGKKKVREWFSLITFNCRHLWETKAGMWQHLILLTIIVAFVAGIYAQVTQAYFCAYDDFIEIHRAAFEDSRDPSRVVSTSHFDSYKYRPLNRAITLGTYSVARDNPMFFRIRNVGFHLLNVILVYALGWLLFRSHRVSGVGTLLFGLHPLANQTIIGAVWSNTIAHAGVLLALVMFIISARCKQLWPLWLVISLVSGWLSLLTYDTSIIVFGLMCMYLAAELFIRSETSVRSQFIIAFGIVSGALLSSYFLLRRLFVPQDWEQATTSVPELLTVVKNMAMYLVALFSPVDPILANEWFLTPLPSEMVMSQPIVIVFGASALAVASTLVVSLWWPKHKPHEINWAAIIFLVSGICLPLSPVLALQSRPSETYLYLPVAFYGLLISYIVTRVLPPTLAPIGRGTSLSILLVVAGFFATATCVRNDRVFQCGETARQILFSLPGRTLKEGSWKLSFANIPGEEATRRYGFYGFRGVDVIGGGGSGEEAITRALQLVYKNESLNGEVVQAGDFLQKCRTGLFSHHLCIWVHSDGRLEEYRDKS